MLFSNLGHAANHVIIILIAWIWVWVAYNYLIRPHFANPLLNDPLTRFAIDLPDSMKCYVKDVSRRAENNDCTKENLDGWSLGHLAIYYTIGLYVPDAHAMVLAVSMGCEVWEYYAGWRARWLLDPLTNVLGYQLGVWHARHWQPAFPIAVPTNAAATVMLVAALLVSLHINNPNMVKKKMEST